MVSVPYIYPMGRKGQMSLHHLPYPWVHLPSLCGSLDIVLECVKHSEPREYDDQRVINSIYKQCALAVFIWCIYGVTREKTQSFSPDKSSRKL